MTVVPASAAEVLPHPSPIVGSEDDPLTVYSYLGDVMNDALSFHAALNSAQLSLGRMEGRAVQSLSARTNVMVTSSVSVRWSMSDARDAFQSYSEAVRDIHSQARSTEGEVEEALTEIRGAASRIGEISQRIGVLSNYVWNEPPSTEMPEPRVAPDGTDECASAFLGDAFEWASAALSWQGAYAVIEAARHRWRGIGSDRKASERGLVASLESTDVGQVLQLGGGATSADLSRIMTTALTLDRPWEPQLVQDLLSGAPSPEEVAAVWEQLQKDGIDVDRLLREYCFELSTLDGLPFWAMDTAGRAAIDYALDPNRHEHLQEAFLRIGFGESEMSLARFREELQAVQHALDDADELAGPEDTVQLVALGRHDGAVTAGISMGDLDGASTVGVFVSGMNSNVREISDAFDAFKRIRNGDTDMAMVTWTGYNSPNITEEGFQGKADAGGVRLASFLDGVAVRREDNPIDRFVGMGHSYGTNVLAEALKLTNAPVDAFVTLGSAGMRYGTVAQDLGVDEVHATHADGDDIAGIGRHVHIRYHAEDGAGVYQARADPRKLDEAREFSSDGENGGKTVTMHNLKHPIDWPDWLLGAQWLADSLDGTEAADEVGYLHQDSSTVLEVEKIMREEWR